VLKCGTSQNQDGAYIAGMSMFVYILPVLNVVEVLLLFFFVEDAHCTFMVRLHLQFSTADKIRHRASTKHSITLRVRTMSSYREVDASL